MPKKTTTTANLLNRKSIKSALTAGVAAAMTFSSAPLARANVVGTDMQNFNPTSSGLDFVTVQSSETLSPGVINLGLFLNYAVNTLPYFDSTPQGHFDFNDTILGLDLNAGLGLTRNWDIGMSLPHVLLQTVEDQNGARGEFESTGGTEVRFNTKYRVYGDNTGGVALVGSMSINRIVDNPWLGEDAGPTFTGEIAADTTIDKIALGANIGYRFRNTGEPILNSRVNPLKNQLIASAAASYHVSDINTKVIGEVFGSLPAERSDADGDRSLTSIEALLGAKHDINTNLALHAGGGVGLNQGVASPDWRIYTGVNYTFGPLWGSESTVSTPPPVEERHLVVLTPVDPESKASGIERFRTQAILFEFDSDRMVGSYVAALEELSQYLRRGFSRLVIEGHTDSIGADGYNQRLSLKRAEAIKRYLVNRYKFDGRKISTIGYGESRPIADNGNYQGRQTNRRVEFVIRR